MKNILILHGTGDNSENNWFPWLKTELNNRGYNVWVPDLPQSDRPNIQRYNEYIFSKWKFNRDSIIVGHSSGAVAILGILQELPEEIVIDRVLLVAGFTDDLNYNAVKEMFVRPFKYQKIKTKANKFILIHSDNDPYVPLWHGEKLKNLLNAELIILKGQKHFSLSTVSGYDIFPTVLHKILE